jgi:hypothetical protein
MSLKRGRSEERSQYENLCTSHHCFCHIKNPPPHLCCSSALAHIHSVLCTTTQSSSVCSMSISSWLVFLSMMSMASSFEVPLCKEMLPINSSQQISLLIFLYILLFYYLLCSKTIKSLSKIIILIPLVVEDGRQPPFT